MGVIVLGIDGASLHVLEPMARRGLLPAFKTLLDEGSSGILASTVPAFTPPAWTSISTGVNPGRHGIFDFQHVGRDYRPALVHAGLKKAPELWDLATARKCVVAHLPITYPPRDLNGIMISCMLTPGLASDCSRPPEYARRIREAMPDYRFDLNWLKYIGRTEKMAGKCEELLAQRSRLLGMLMEEERDLLFFVAIEMDRAQHIMWGAAELERVCRSIDGMLSELMRGMGEHDNLLVVSDHGFEETGRRIYLNTLLEELGYLKRKEAGLKASGRLKGTARRSLRKASSWRITAKTLNLLPEAWIDAALHGFMADKDPGSALPDLMDAGESAAFATGPGYVYLNREERFTEGRIKAAQEKEWGDRLRSDLADLKDPASGTALFRRVWLGREIYRGPCVETGPDLVVEPSPGYSLSARWAEDAFEDLEKGRGDHHPDGLFLAWGPDIAHVDIAGLTVLDVAPTILHMMGEEIPPGLEGRVAGEIFLPCGKLAGQPRLIDDSLERWTRERIVRLRKSGRI